MTKSDLPTSLNRSRLSKPKLRKPTIEGASPIAADGGFGPMDDDESGEESDGSDEEVEADAEVDTNEDLGEDFDDFEAGAEDEDFGDFDEGFQPPSVADEESEEPEPTIIPVQPLPPSTFSYVSIANAVIQKSSPCNALPRHP